MLKNGVQENDILELINKEYKASTEEYEKKFPQLLYAYGILKEECEELEEATMYAHDELNRIWSQLREHDPDDTTVKKYAKNLLDESINSAVEAVQLGAMALKLIKS